MAITKESYSLAYILFKNGDLGPEQIYYENIPSKIHDNFNTLSIELGLYLSLVISQGKGLDQEGLYGPLPWYQLQDHELFLFSFLVSDPKTKDKRKKSETLAFLVVIFPRTDESLIHSRYEIQKSLEQELIHPKASRIVLNKINIAKIIDKSKTIFVKANDSGTKVLQEQALDEVIAFESMELFALYSLKNKTLKSCLVGEEAILPGKEFFQARSLDEYQISMREHEDGSSSLIFEFKELDTIVYVKLNHILKTHNLIRLLSKIDSSLGILASYI